MIPDHEPLAEHEAELTPLLREALRAHTPPGLSEAQREALDHEVRAVRRARAPRKQALLALAAALPLALATGWYTLAREPIAPAQREEVAVETRPEVTSAPRASDAQRTAEVARLRALEEARAAAERDAREAAVRAKAAGALESPTTASSAGAAHDMGRIPERCMPPEQAGEKRRARAFRPCPPASRSRSASGGCDPNDPLCGL